MQPCYGTYMETKCKLPPWQTGYFIGLNTIACFAIFQCPFPIVLRIIAQLLCSLYLAFEYYRLCKGNCWASLRPYTHDTWHVLDNLAQPHIVSISPKSILSPTGLWCLLENTNNKPICYGFVSSQTVPAEYYARLRRQLYMQRL
jgi:hypothetical protein